MSDGSCTAVLDASALLAVLNDEPGAEVVLEYLPGALVSTVNVAEVAGKLLEAGVPEDDVRAVLTEAGIRVIPFEEEEAVLVGALRRRTRRAGLSLGDRACLALALTRDLPAVTTDSAWKRVDVGVRVVVARGPCP